MVQLNDGSVLIFVCDPGVYSSGQPYEVKVLRSIDGSVGNFIELSTIFTQALTETPTGYGLPYSIAMPSQMNNGRIICATTIIETVGADDVGKVAIFVSDNNGLTWIEKWRGANSDILNNTTFTDNVNIIDNSLNSFVFITGKNSTGTSILYSEDGGDTWTLKTDFLNSLTFIDLAFKMFDDGYLYRAETIDTQTYPTLYRFTTDVVVSIPGLESADNWVLMENQGVVPTREYWNQLTLGPSGTIHLLTEDGQTATNVTMDFVFIRKPIGVTVIPGIDSTDERLVTTSKTLVGATNELAVTTNDLVTTTGTLTTDVGDLQTLYSSDLLAFLEAMNGGP
jgi:hypothetical protein